MDALKENNTLSVIVLGECEKVLKDKNHIADNTSLIILKYEKKTGHTNEKVIQYEIYDPNTYNKLDLSVCENNINIYIPITLNQQSQQLFDEVKEQEYNLLDIDGDFYNDICTPFSSQKDTDVILNDRINYYFSRVSNDATCPKNCQFAQYLSDNNKLRCICEINTESIKAENTANSSLVIDDSYKNYLNDYKYSSAKTMKCSNLVFDSKTFGKNAGGILVLLFFTGYIAFMCLYFYKKLSPLKQYISQIMSKDTINNEFNLSDVQTKKYQNKENEDTNKDTNKKEEKIENQLNPPKKTIITNNKKPFQLNLRKTNNISSINKNNNLNTNNNANKNSNNSINNKTMTINKTNANNNVKKIITRTNNKPNITTPIKNNTVNNKTLNNTGNINNLNNVDIKENEKIINNNAVSDTKKDEAKTLNNNNTNTIDITKNTRYKHNIRNKIDGIEVHSIKSNDSLKPNLKANLETENIVKTNAKFDLDEEEKKFDEISVKDIQNLDDYEIYHLEFLEAIKLDKRNYLSTYLSILKRQQLIWFTFLSWNDYNLFYLKIDRFIFLLVTALAMNSLLFADKTIHKLYMDEGKYDFGQALPQIIYSLLIAHALEIFLCFLTMTDIHIYEIKALKKTKKSTEMVVKIIKLMRIKLIIFFAFTSILFIFYWYCVTAFCAVYQKTQGFLILNSFFTFLIHLIDPFIIYAIITILRILALKYSDKKGSLWMYKISKFFPIF